MRSITAHPFSLHWEADDTETPGPPNTPNQPCPLSREGKGTAHGMSWGKGPVRNVRRQSHRGSSLTGEGREGSGGGGVLQKSQDKAPRSWELGLGRILKRLALLFLSILRISPKVMPAVFQMPDTIIQKLSQESSAKP